MTVHNLCACVPLDLYSSPHPYFSCLRALWLNMMPRTGSLPDFLKWESCRTMPLVGRFSRGYPVSSPLHPVAAPFLPHFNPIGTQDLTRVHQWLGDRYRGFQDRHRVPPASRIKKGNKNNMENARGRKLKLASDLGTWDLGTLGGRAVTSEGHEHQSAFRRLPRTSYCGLGLRRAILYGRRGFCDMGSRGVFLELVFHPDARVIIKRGLADVTAAWRRRKNRRKEKTEHTHAHTHAYTRTHARPHSACFGSCFVFTTLDSTVLCILEYQLCVLWLLPQRVVSVSPRLAVWDSLLISFPVCYWLRVVQSVSNKLRTNYEVNFSVHMFDAYLVLK
ncbi:hypothetical protein PR048_033402 [Dryococelus australis]|uniref:Uncharacterized protein n=1 Tax=Dryococelus australis TaxID=614101 RepID=A0ABQ9G068_9NEOP|nr:hypothetical protein PR048_033402 [Dryococelus australis]